MKRFYYFHKRANYNICFVSSNFLVEKNNTRVETCKILQFLPDILCGFMSETRKNTKPNSSFEVAVTCRLFPQSNRGVKHC